VQKVKPQKQKYTLFTAKALLWLILPIVIEQIFSTSLGLFDSMMVSNIPSGGTASNAVSNVNYINNLIIQLFSAFATGGVIITSQFLGAKDTENANKSAKQVLVLVIIISVVIGVLCLALNWPLLKLFYPQVSSQVFDYSQIYFYITAASFPFIGLFNVCAALLRAQRKSTVTMISAAISCGVNVGLNALFLFVFDMGVVGVGLATLICRLIPAIYMLLLLTKKSYVVHIKIFEKFRFDGGMIKRILKLAIPAGIESCLFQLGKLMTNTFVNAGCYANGEFAQQVVDEAGNITYLNIQANGNNIANEINNIASVVGSGVGTSCLTVIGQSVGAGDVGQCKHYMKKMFLLSYILNGICCGIILACVPFIVNLFGFVPEAKEIGRNCLYFCLCFQFVTYPLSFTTPAILKATSDVKYVMFSAVASMFIMRVGLAFLLTTDLIPGLPKMGAFGYWIGMCSDWVLRSVLFLTRLLSGRWKKSSGLLTAQPAAACHSEQSEAQPRNLDQSAEMGDTAVTATNAQNLDISIDQSDETSQ